MAYDFTRQLDKKIANLIKEVEGLKKRVTELERDRGSTREILTLPKRRPGRPKKTDAA